MSTVTNPYTFNIKSNCEFSTIIPIDENTYLTKLAVKYSHEMNAMSYFLKYSNNMDETSLEPNIINGISILNIQLMDIIGPNINRTSCQIITSGKRYSKIILNDSIGIFDNIEVSYNTITNDKDLYIYDNGLKGIHPDNWSNVFSQISSFDLTIKFIE